MARARASIPLMILGSLLLPSPGAAQGRSPDRIQAIVVRREAVFDSVEARFWPYRVANTLHVETRPWVIRRELLFAVGDRYDPAVAAESERNLRALGIFRDVFLEADPTDSGIVVIVHTADAWTTTMGVGVASSESQSVVDLSLQEGNLFGTRTVAVLGYRNDPDRSAITMAFDTPRAIADRLGVGVSVVDRSDGRAGTFSVRAPFLSLSAREGGSVSASYLEGRVLRFAAGSPLPIDSLWRKSAILRADAAVALRASPRGYVRMGVAAQARREDVVPLLQRDAIPRTVFLAVGPTLTARAPRYRRVTNVASMDRIEDVDLGPSLSLGVLVAPSAWGYPRTGIGSSLGLGAGIDLPSGFARAGVRAAALFTADGTDSSSVEAAATVVLQPDPRHLLVAHASGGILRNPAPGFEFDLGLGTGLRAFPAHAFTGDRQFVLNAEYRALLWPRLFGLVGVGAAAFAGSAGAWFHGSDVRSGTEFGVGLRLASIREVGGIWRLDLSRRQATDRLPSAWLVSIGRGFVFGAL
jgi:hypothetical protein